MVGEAPGDPELDDWFDEPRPRSSSRPDSEAADDWLSGVGEIGRARPSFDARSLRTRRGAIVAAVGAAVLLLIGLAAAGVFSGGGGQATAPATTAPTTASASTQPAAPTATAPATTLKPGATGAQVKALQRSLQALGYPAGKIDGQYGPGTKKALAAFQKAHGLTADGVLGPKSLAALAAALGKTG